ncbi:hypothetical protein BXZ70DRAFT_897117 [Cristinia sonorae]|uniref:Uncharacterized protein n=1 Tax=Cristinia sonorae TaxID=1940300 RepID=A0A8K0XMJ0_9AGAR|nr:hypothetical protein BXZ70DRAFT_897117 [Cristinia sonorae]
MDLQRCYAPAVNGLPPRRPIEEIIAPYPNLSSFLLARHHWLGGETKTLANRDSLLALLTSEVYRNEDIKGVDFEKLEKQLFEQAEDAVWGAVRDGWTQSSVPIGLPSNEKSTAASRRAASAAQQRQNRIPLSVPGFWHKNLCHEIRRVLSTDPAVARFVWDPHYLEYSPGPGQRSEKVHGELYNSPAFIQEDLHLQNSPPEEGCNLPRVILACMFASDATQVTQWGQKKVWPNYLYFGNQSKYERARPSMHAGHLVGYFPSLPDNLQDFIRETFGKAASAPYLTHCKRELFHGAWSIMLDDEFVEAYIHGIVITCSDGVRRRVYPRIFIYSADYPEKVLVATLRDKGTCPCVRCLVKFPEIPNMGTPEDMAIRSETARQDDTARQEMVETARKLIYEEGYVVNSKHVEDLLKATSAVPTKNAFSERIQQRADTRFNFHRILSPDHLHEWEIGNWKAIFLHLIRILEAVSPELVHEMNKRFRQVPVFGRGTIRKFSTSVSDMKRMAARDYEDILQCVIPCIEDLLPSPHNEAILDLLYVCNYWHALSKMRMHTDTSLQLFEHVTSVLGTQLRHFERITCLAFTTKETQKERATRIRAESRGVTSRASGALSSTDNVSDQSSDNRRSKKFHVKTIKHHSLGDYPSYIREHGTTDSYTTKISEQRHREPKAQHIRVSARNPQQQLIKVETIQNRLRQMQQELERDHGVVVPTNLPATKRVKRRTDAPRIQAEEHHHIAENDHTPLYLREWQTEHSNDPAITNFARQLEAHICERLNLPIGPVVFKHERILRHATFHINFTTYDLQRDQDMVHLSTDRLTVMVSTSPEESDSPRCPWMYAKVLGIFHAEVIPPGESEWQRIEFLWVRWMQRDTSSPSGVAARRLERLSYMDICDEDSLGFVDPAAVIRACHLIPVFHLHRADPPDEQSIAFDAGGDWNFYNVMRFADQDINARYLGLGVGHIGPTKAQVAETITEFGPGPVIPDLEDTPSDVAASSRVADGAGEHAAEETSDSESDDDGQDPDVDGDDNDSLDGNDAFYNDLDL